MSPDIDKESSYYRAIPRPHPAIEKYHFTMADIHREGMTHGIAPPTLFGILIGRIKSNSVIDSRLKLFIDPQDVQSLHDDYDPLRNYQFVNTDKDRNKYVVHQRYPAGMCKKGDSIHTDDDRWMILSDVEKTNSQCKFFSGGVLVMSLSKSTLLTVAVAVSEKNPHVGENPLPTKDKGTPSTVKFFERSNPDDFDYNELYQTIYDNI